MNWIQKSIRFECFLVPFLAVLAGCVSPALVSNEPAPGLNTCRYKTYSFQEPTDQTRQHWLSVPEQRKVLEDVIRESLRSTGLTEVAYGTPSDLRLYYTLVGREMSPLQSTGTVIMASEYRLATLTIDFWDDSDAKVWRTHLQQVIGDMRGSNRERARDALTQAFAEYPACKQ